MTDTQWIGGKEWLDIVNPERVTIAQLHSTAKPYVMPPPVVIENSKKSLTKKRRKK